MGTRSETLLQEGIEYFVHLLGHASRFPKDNVYRLKREAFLAGITSGMLCCKDLKSSGIVLISLHPGLIILSKEDSDNEREGKGENSVKKCSMMIYVLTLLALCGCSTLIQSSYGVAVDERKVGTIAADEQIKRTIQAKLLGDDAIKILDISAFCYDSHVYLVGEYGTEKEKERALEIASHVQGVTSVTQYLLRIKKEDTCGWRDNLEIGAKIRAKLIGDKEISSTNIDVKAIQCHVVLLGIVGSKKEVAKAIAHTKSVTGVRGVTSYLKAAN